MESNDIEGVVRRLSELGVHYSKSVSVPDPKKSRANKFEENLETKPTAVVQYFLRDPDGYYIELCNCDILTDYCFGSSTDPERHQHLPGYVEGVTLKTMMGAIHWRHVAHDPHTLQEHLAAFDRAPAPDADPAKLANLVARRATYGDICQGFSEAELRDVLRRAGNDVRVAVAHLTAVRAGDRILVPPPHFDGSNQSHQPKPIHLHTSHLTPL